MHVSSYQEQKCFGKTLKIGFQKNYRQIFKKTGRVLVTVEKNVFNNFEFVTVYVQTISNS